MSAKNPTIKVIERTCNFCNKHFWAKLYAVKQGNGRYCSRPCAWESYKIPIEIRFWNHVQKTDGCWLWTGNRTSFGYGLIKNKTSMLAHRVSWELHYGAIPDGMCVLHKCDNPPCTNPKHLFIGTDLDNSRDMYRKGRGNDGSRNCNSKISEQDVSEIRSLASIGTPYINIVKRFGISPCNISNIVHRRAWKHVP